MNDLHLKIEREKKIADVIHELEEKTKKLNSEVNRAGWIQRSTLISHVYSGYNMQEELIIKNSTWKKLMFERNVHEKLLDYLLEFRDIYGLFSEYMEMLKALDDLIKLAIKREEYEVALILKEWQSKFPTTKLTMIDDL